MQMLNKVYQEPALFLGATFPNLPLTRYRLTFEAREELTMPAFAGPLWRSVLGPQLKDAGEVLFQHFYQKDVPPYIISTPLTDGDQLYKTRDFFGFELTLIGRANSVVSTVLECFDKAARIGLGKGKKQAHLVDVVTTWHPDGVDKRQTNSVESPAIPPMPSQVCIEFMTPVSLKMKRSKALVKAGNFQAFDFFDKLVRRVSTLMRDYTDQELNADFKHLKYLGERAGIKENFLEDCYMKRWSSRQQKDVPLDGMVGVISLDMPDIKELWPYLWLGQWTHVGKNAVMGCGAYHIFVDG